MRSNEDFPGSRAGSSHRFQDSAVPARLRPTERKWTRWHLSASRFHAGGRRTGSADSSDSVFMPRVKWQWDPPPYAQNNRGLIGKWPDCGAHPPRLEYTRHAILGTRLSNQRLTGNDSVEHQNRGAAETGGEIRKVAGRLPGAQRGAAIIACEPKIGRSPQTHDRTVESTADAGGDARTTGTRVQASPVVSTADSSHRKSGRTVERWPCTKGPNRPRTGVSSRISSWPPWRDFPRTLGEAVGPEDGAG